MFDSSRLHGPRSRPRPTRARRRRLAAHPELLEGRLLLTFTLESLGQVSLPPFYDVTRGVVAINSASEVAATGGTYPSAAAYFLNSNGQRTQLSPLSGDSNSTATGLNGSDYVAGYAWNLVFGSVVPEAVLYNSQGKPTDLGNLGGPSQATGIDDSTQVVGDSATGTAYNSPTHAFLYNRSGPLIDLGTLGGARSVATAINDATEIVGDSSTAGSGSPTHAFLHKGTGPLTSSDDLGVPDGYTNSYATAISSNGLYVAGYATKTITGSNGLTETASEPFLYSGGKWTDLGNLGGSDAVATGVNASGEVVGYAMIPRTGSLGGTITEAFVSTRSGGIQDLNKLIDGDSKSTVENATSINDNGVIGGIGYGSTGQYDGFLLHPMNNGGGGGGGGGGGSGGGGTGGGGGGGGGGGHGGSGGGGGGGSNPGDPQPAPSPNSGLFQTKTSLTARPRSADVGRPVTLTATVKVDGKAHGTPAGPVTFLEGSTVLGVVPLNHGQARLVTSSLPLGPDPIAVQYAGGPSFAPSQSGVMVETIKAPHSRVRFAHHPIARTSTEIPGGVSHSPGEAATLATSTILGPIATGQAQRLHARLLSAGTHPGRMVSDRAIDPTPGGAWSRKPTVTQASAKTSKDTPRLVDAG